MNDQIEKSVEVLNQGGIVIFPTDTAFGIGCRIDNEKAIERLFKIRKRPLNQATPVLFDTIERIKEYVLPLDKNIEKLMHQYWPGALTVIVKCKKNKVPDLVRGGGENLGVRIPDHRVPIALIKKTGVPILGPSANIHGELTPYMFNEIDKKLIRLADFVLEGKTKQNNLASTVVDCSKTPWKILRLGALNINI